MSEAITLRAEITKDELDAQLVAGQLIINGTLEIPLLGEMPLEVILTVTDHEPKTGPQEAMADPCWDCGHPLNHHSGQGGDGCYECKCKRWFAYYGSDEHHPGRQ